MFDQLKGKKGRQCDKYRRQEREPYLAAGSPLKLKSDSRTTLVTSTALTSLVKEGSA